MPIKSLLRRRGSAYAYAEALKRSVADDSALQHQQFERDSKRRLNHSDAIARTKFNRRQSSRLKRTEFYWRLNGVSFERAAKQYNGRGRMDLASYIIYLVPEACSPAGHHFWEYGGLYAAIISVGVGLTASRRRTQRLWVLTITCLGRDLQGRQGVLVFLAAIGVILLFGRWVFGGTLIDFANEARSTGEDLIAGLYIDFVFIITTFFFVFLYMNFRNVLTSSARTAAREISHRQAPISLEPPSGSCEMSLLRIENSIGRFSLWVAAIGIIVEIIDKSLHLHDCITSPFKPQLIALSMAILFLIALLLAKRRAATT